MSAHRFGLGMRCVVCGLSYSDFVNDWTHATRACGAPEARAEGRSPAERPLTVTEEAGATTETNPLLANLKEAP